MDNIKSKNAKIDKRRVLIVDDHPVNLKILSAIIKDKYIVQVATCGKQAIEMVFGNNPPDLILLDVVMPDMDGYEVCKIIKNNIKTNHIPIIFVTANDSETDEEYGLNLGAADYITKPVNPTIVNARIQTHIELKDKEDKLINKIQENETLLRILSHDLNNLLSVPIGFSELGQLLNEKGSKNYKYFSSISNSMNSAMELVVSVKNMMAFETGKLKLVLKPYLVSNFLLSAKNTFQKKLKDKS